jgi:hypothetical protein
MLSPFAVYCDIDRKSAEYHGLMRIQAPSELQAKSLHCLKISDEYSLGSFS